jgi:hypothetical protein
VFLAGRGRLHRRLQRLGDDSTKDFDTLMWLPGTGLNPATPPIHVFFLTERTASLFALAIAVLRRGTAGPGCPAVVATMIITAICVPIGGHVRIIGLVGFHRASPSLRDSERDTMNAYRHN